MNSPDELRQRAGLGRLASLLIPLVTCQWLVSDVSAQNTTPHWASLFGGSARDEVTAISHGPGGQMTICGYSNSTDLPIAQATGAMPPLQVANGGGYDVFVARLDTTLPAANQLLWLTYLGGSGDEFAFDVNVEPASGIVTVVGVSESANFPGGSGLPSPPQQGVSDGFVALISPDGSTLLGSMFVGGSGGDVASCAVTDASLNVTIAGTTGSNNLPATAGTVFPTYRGGSTDAFVAKVSPLSSQVLWSTYLGGGGHDGNDYGDYLASGGWPNYWEGFLDKLDLVVTSSGELVVATVSQVDVSPAYTTNNAAQPLHGGASDCYLCVLDANATAIQYATFFGGLFYDAPMSLAAHPAGGYVVGGYTYSFNLPVTASCLQPTFQSAGASSIGANMDGFVCHVDPAMGAAGLRYGTYFGGNMGEDAVVGLAVASSGIVTVAGYCVGGGSFPLTQRGLHTGPGGSQFYGVVSCLAMNGQGSQDLYYSSRVGSMTAGDTWLSDLVLDEQGNVYVVGATDAASFPVQNAFQNLIAGAEDACLVHLPPLPGCTERTGVALAVPACSESLYIGMAGVPMPGVSFAVTAANAPPLTIGVLVLGAATPPLPIPLPFNGQLLVTPTVLLTALTDGLGAAHAAIAIPLGIPAACPWNLAAQWAFFTNAACPGSGLLATSERLQF
tara:strand:- start:59997 stop:62012 length:2016 start_codon:yes stop_codon:yes gene_type:complete